jgi:L-lactate utilization protein LutB
MDLEKNIEKIKKNNSSKKLKIFEKHNKIEEMVSKVREKKAHLVEYNRIANEIRL